MEQGQKIISNFLHKDRCYTENEKRLVEKFLYKQMVQKLEKLEYIKLQIAEFYTQRNELYKRILRHEAEIDKRGLRSRKNTMLRGDIDTAAME